MVELRAIIMKPVARHKEQEATEDRKLGEIFVNTISDKAMMLVVNERCLIRKVV